MVNKEYSLNTWFFFTRIDVIIVALESDFQDVLHESLALATFAVIGMVNQGLLKDGQESFSKIYQLFFRRYMPKPQ